MSAEKAEQPKAGWYPDPVAANTRRFWDGEAWTANRQEVRAAGVGQRTGLPIFFFFVGLVLVLVGAFVMYGEFPRVHSSPVDLFSTTGNIKAVLLGAVIFWMGSMVLIFPIVVWGTKYASGE